MSELKFDAKICAKCEKIDCLTRCQHMALDLLEARQERDKILAGQDSRVLHECLTCYACEEFCPYQNHPFYLIVDRQEELKVWPVPVPLTKQQIAMMAPKGKLSPQKVSAPVINLCSFPMLAGCIQGKLFAGASIISGNDLFCNVMWLHFAKNSVIRERLPKVIANLMDYYLRDSGVSELVCFHDECYGAYTQLAPAFGLEVPFRPVHLFEYLVKKLTGLKKEIQPIHARVAYQRPCSNRLVPETQPWVDEIFKLIGAERPAREFEGENALCCGMVVRAAQRDAQADVLQKRNLFDMAATGAQYCVFNCPMCFMTLRGMVAERGMTPILMSDLCRLAVGEGFWG